MSALNNWLKIFDMFGVFNKTCSECGASKSGRYWEHDEFPGKTFCKKSCLNKYLKVNSLTMCDMCQRPCGTNTYTLVDDNSKLFCKKGCVDRYVRSEPCTNCSSIHGSRTYKHQGKEFGSKQCKAHYIAREKLSKSLNKYG